jgi:hypothetical protein
VSSSTYFLNPCEDKKRRFKSNLTLSLILRFNLRFGRYSIWSANLIAPHIKANLKTTRGMSTSQPRSSQESTHLQDEVRKNSKTPSEVLGSLQYSITKSYYQIRSYGTAHTYSRIRDGAWPTPYTGCNYSYRSRTSRNRGNYLSVIRVGLLSSYLARIFI